MGFGFVVARFGLFLQALLSNGTKFAVQPYGLSFWFGTALIVVGVVVNLLSAASHVRLVGQLKRGESYSGPSRLAVVVALLLAVLGLAMAGYLLSVETSPKEEKTAVSSVAFTRKMWLSI